MLHDPVFSPTQYFMLVPEFQCCQDKGTQTNSFLEFPVFICSWENSSQSPSNLYSSNGHVKEPFSLVVSSSYRYFFSSCPAGVHLRELPLLCNFCFFFLHFNPLGTKSDQHQFSPSNISRTSRVKVMRITKLITKGRIL